MRTCQNFDAIQGRLPTPRLPCCCVAEFHESRNDQEFGEFSSQHHGERLVIVQKHLAKRFLHRRHSRRLLEHGDDLCAELDARVKEVLVSPGTQVETGELTVQLE